MSDSRNCPPENRTSSCGKGRQKDKSQDNLTPQQIAENVYQNLPPHIKEHIMNFALNGVPSPDDSDESCACDSAEDAENFKQALKLLFELSPCVQNNLLFLAFEEANKEGCSKIPQVPRKFNESSVEDQSTIKPSSRSSNTSTLQPSKTSKEAPCLAELPTDSNESCTEQSGRITPKEPSMQAARSSSREKPNLQTIRTLSKSSGIEFQDNLCTCAPKEKSIISPQEVPDSPPRKMSISSPRFPAELETLPCGQTFFDHDSAIVSSSRKSLDVLGSIKEKTEFSKPYRQSSSNRRKVKAMMDTSNPRKNSSNKGCAPNSCDNLDFEKLLIDKILYGDIKNINPEEVRQLVDKESDDCDIFLTPEPPYIARNPGTFDAKYKSQKFGGSGRSFTFPPISTSADEAQYDPTPEMMVQIMQLIEEKCDPTIDTNAHFNTLFNSTNVGLGTLMEVSPMAEGHFQNVVVPLKVPSVYHKELVTKEIMSLSRKLAEVSKLNPDEAPRDDLYKDVRFYVDATLEKLKVNFDIQDEPPWGEEDLSPAVQVMGTEPTSVLNVTDIKTLEDDSALTAELQKGIEYFVEAKTPQYKSRVELRGSKPPSWLPGYAFAVPYCPVTQVARSPSEVFRKSWIACNPKRFRPDSLIVN